MAEKSNAAPPIAWRSPTVPKRIIEKTGEVNMTASAVSAAVQARGKINRTAAGMEAE